VPARPCGRTTQYRQRHESVAPRVPRSGVRFWWSCIAALLAVVRRRRAYDRAAGWMTETSATTRSRQHEQDVPYRQRWLKCRSRSRRSLTYDVAILSAASDAWRQSSVLQHREKARRQTADSTGTMAGCPGTRHRSTQQEPTNQQARRCGLSSGSAQPRPSLQARKRVPHKARQ
jgi:hypothetical protein